MQQFGGAVKQASDYVTRRLNASSAGLKSPWGWTFADRRFTRFPNKVVRV